MALQPDQNITHTVSDTYGVTLDEKFRSYADRILDDPTGYCVYHATNEALEYFRPASEPIDPFSFARQLAVKFALESLSDSPRRGYAIAVPYMLEVLGTRNIFPQTTFLSDPNQYTRGRFAARFLSQKPMHKLCDDIFGQPAIFWHRTEQSSHVEFVAGSQQWTWLFGLINEHEWRLHSICVLKAEQQIKG